MLNDEKKHFRSKKNSRAILSIFSKTNYFIAIFLLLSFLGRKPPSPDFDDLPPPPRPEELPKGNVNYFMIKVRGIRDLALATCLRKTIYCKRKFRIEFEDRYITHLIQKIENFMHKAVKVSAVRFYSYLTNYVYTTYYL
jgi:hypothetical protein